MKWSALLSRSGLGAHPPGDDPMVTGVVEDSRAVRPGACFVAVRGSRVDGHDFVPAAVRAGAAVVVTERPVEVPPGVVHLQLPSTRGVTGRLLAVLTGLAELQRSGRFRVAGITGTNGKSTFCFLTREILRAAGHPTALLGTIQYDLLSRVIEADLTTPGAAALMGYLAEAAKAGASHAVMEVSSIALDQGRAAGVDFAVGVFSNLTGDHLDYHGTMENYLAAKKRLFDGLRPDATAVVNVDDPAGEQMVVDCRARVLRYGIRHAPSDSGQTPSAQRVDGPALWADVRSFTAAGTEFDLVATGDQAGRASVRSLLVGRHNVQNCLAAAGAALALGVPLETIADGLSKIRCVPGRLQRVLPADGSETNVTVLVDYAHTDDALVNVLSALRPLTRGQLITMFGCGGDRDRTKRPRMAQAAARFSDRIVVTSDNPRTEDPDAIIRDIMTGFPPEASGRVLVEPDRRRAIYAALAAAGPGDVVLLAGKGHENYQIIGQERHPFDDAVIAAEALAERLRGRGAA